MVSQLNPFEEQNQLGQQGLEGGDRSQPQADGSLEQGVGGAEDITRSLERVAPLRRYLRPYLGGYRLRARVSGESV